MSVVIRSYNCPARLPDGRTAKEVARVTRGAHVNAWQESTHLIGDLEARGLCINDWSEPASLRSLPISTAARGVEVTGQAALCAYPDTKVGAWGAGPSTLRAGWDHAVRVKVKDLEFWVINVHLAPSVTREVNTKAERAARERRRELHLLEVQQIKEMLDGMDRAIAIGDWNCRPGYEGLFPLRRDRKLRIVSPGPTHGDNPIDWAVVKGLEVVSSRVMPRGYGEKGDHRPIEVVVR